MAESALNARLLQALRGQHAIRVENSAWAGTPDINFAGGWIESKWLPRWPKKGIVKLRHFTPQQRVWHQLRDRAGGRSWVVLQVKHTYLVYNGNIAALNLGKYDEAITRRMALGVWEHSLDDEAFRRLLGCE